MKKRLTKIIGLISVFSLLVFIALPGVTVSAATTQDITVTATPAYVSISCNQTDLDYGVVAANITSNTTTNWATIDNTSTVQTDQTIGVTTSTWAGGVTWTHSDTCTVAEDTAGMKANKNGTWGTGDVIVKYSSPNYIAENQTADTDYYFGLSLWTPESFTDGVEKTITVRVSAVSG